VRSIDDQFIFGDSVLVLRCWPAKRIEKFIYPQETGLISGLTKESMVEDTLSHQRRGKPAVRKKAVRSAACCPVEFIRRRPVRHTVNVVGEHPQLHALRG